MKHTVLIMRHYVFILVFLLVYSGCSSPNKQVTESDTTVLKDINLAEGINKETSSLLLSDAISNIDIVKLGLTDKSLVGDIQNLIVTDNSIFISDSKSGVLRFSRNGQFLNTIGKQGQGPGEYLYLSDIMVDERNSSVYLHTTKDLLVFDYNGNYKKTYNINYEDIFISPKGRILFTGNNFFFNNQLPIVFPNKDLWTLASVDSSFNITDTFCNPAFLGRESLIREKAASSVEFNKDQYSESPTLVDFYNKEFEMIYYGGDTIYRYDKNQFVPCYSLNMGERPSFEMSHEWLKQEAFFAYLWLYEFYETKDYIYFVLGKSEDLFTVRYNKENGEMVSSKEKSSIKVRKTPYFTHRRFEYDFKLNNDLLGGQFKVDYQGNNYWCQVISPSELSEEINIDELEKQEVKDNSKRKAYLDVLKQLKEEDNPVLVIATLK